MKGGFYLSSKQDMRDALICNTIQLVAEGGFEKATTKAITQGSNHSLDVKLNEVYIYRLFGSKEQLYQAAFERVDREFVSALRKRAETIKPTTGTHRDRLYVFFLRAWDFLMQNEERCRFYVRFYYSVYFRGEALASHRQTFAEIVAIFQPLFREEADVESIMHSVLTTLLNFAVRVYNGNLENTVCNASHVFNVLYCMMMTYYKIEYQEQIPTV